MHALGCLHAAALALHAFQFPNDRSTSASWGYCPANSARYGPLLSLHISLYFCMSAEVCNSIASAPDAWSAHKLLVQHGMAAWQPSQPCERTKAVAKIAVTVFDDGVRRVDYALQHDVPALRARQIAIYQNMQTLIASAALHPREGRRVLCQNTMMCHSMQVVIDVMYAGRALVVKTAGCPQLNPHQACTCQQHATCKLQAAGAAGDTQQTCLSVPQRCHVMRAQVPCMLLRRMHRHLMPSQ